MLGSPINKILQEVEVNDAISPVNTPRIATNILKRVVEHRVNRGNSGKNLIKLGSNECTKVAHLCALYQTTLQTLTQLKLDILTGKKYFVLIILIYLYK